MRKIRRFDMSSANRLIHSLCISKHRNLFFISTSRTTYHFRFLSNLRHHESNFDYIFLKQNFLNEQSNCPVMAFHPEITFLIQINHKTFDSCRCTKMFLKIGYHERNTKLLFSKRILTLKKKQYTVTGWKKEKTIIQKIRRSAIWWYY